MTPSLLPRLSKRSFLGGAVAALSTSCFPALRPDCACDANAGTDSAGAQAAADTAPVAVIDRPPRAFTHTSAELFAKLRIGWNLGNSLDVPDGETAWGNPPVSQALLNAVAQAGFKLVRIPVTWSKHMGPGPDFTIESSWFERVNEVVGYAHAAGLYAIINLHHDGAEKLEGTEWIKLNDASGNPTPENNAAVKARFVAVWSQIAKYFSKHGEELLFESMNEIHVGYGTPDPRHFPIINDLNQEFVKLVRGSGGNNEQRHLIVPGYNTSIEHTVKGFVLPKDPTPNRLILSVHFYDPYLFALQAKTHTWGAGAPGRDDWGQEDHVLKQFELVKTTFIDKGIPVLLGEYGATHQAGYEDYRRYYMEYVTKAAVDRKLLPVYWDNGGRGSGGENFGLFDRSNNTVHHPKILEAMQRAATKDYALKDIAPPAPSK